MHLSKPYLLAVFLMLPACAGDFHVDLDEDNSSSSTGGSSEGPEGSESGSSTSGAPASEDSSTSSGGPEGSTGTSSEDDSSTSDGESSEGEESSSSTGGVDPLLPGDSCNPLEDVCIEGWSCLPELIDIEIGLPDLLTMAYMCQESDNDFIYGQVCTTQNHCGNEYTPCLGTEYFPPGDCVGEDCCSEWCDPTHPCLDPSQICGWVADENGLTQTTTDPAAIGYCFVPPEPVLNCTTQGDFCPFNENDPQSTCCDAGVGGNVLGTCALNACQ